MSSIAETGAPRRRRWLALALLLIALNLRATLASVSPLLGELRADFDFDAARAGFLTMLPLLCFGGFGLFAAPLVRRIGAELMVQGLLVTLVLGVLLRSVGPVACLFAGTILAGGAIGMLNVIMPSLLKRDFPNQVGLAMGVYTAAVCVSGAIAAGLTAPIALLTGGGWRVGLGAWAVPAALAAILWWPRMRSRAPLPARPATTGPGLWRNALAWQVTVYMGLQSALFYMVLAWLPTILRDRGLGVVESGFVLSLSVVSQMITSLLAPALAARLTRQRALAAGAIILAIIGFAGCLYAPLEGLSVWAVILGLGQGAALGLGLMFTVLRAGDAQQAARLSGMAQSAGYSLAAFGPFAIGAAHDLTGGWNGGAILFLAVAGIAIMAGLGAGRDIIVPRADA